MSVLDLVGTIGKPSTARDESSARIPDAGYVKGWGVFGLPFDSGHVLALRVFPESDSGAYRSVWHRDPSGDWRLYVDAPHLHTACPRYFGTGATSVDLANIHVAWVGPASAHVTVDAPSLEWTLLEWRFTVSTTSVLRMLNVVSARLPMWTWRPNAMIRGRELLARALGMGDMRLAGLTPSGHYGVQMPKRMYYVDESTAVLDGRDLGRPTRLTSNPRMGFTTFPARGVFAIGEASWESVPRT